MLVEYRRQRILMRIDARVILSMIHQWMAPPGGTTRFSSMWSTL